MGWGPVPWKPLHSWLPQKLSFAASSPLQLAPCPHWPTRRANQYQLLVENTAATYKTCHSPWHGSKEEAFHTHSQKNAELKVSRRGGMRHNLGCGDYTFSGGKCFQNTNINLLFQFWESGAQLAGGKDKYNHTMQNNKNLISCNLTFLTSSLHTELKLPATCFLNSLTCYHRSHIQHRQSVRWCSLFKGGVLDFDFFFFLTPCLKKAEAGKKNKKLIFWK